MQHMRRVRFSFLSLICLGVFACVTLFIGCDQFNLDDILSPAPIGNTGENDAAVAITWFELYLRLIQETPGFSPPVASRALGYAGVTLYESVVPGMPDYQTLVGQLNGLTQLPQADRGQTYHWPTTANSALASITRNLFANATSANMGAIDALEEMIAAPYRAEIPAAIYNRSIARGQAVADAIYAWSKTDGGHEGYARNFPADYIPPTGPGLWEPTPRRTGAPLSALQPYWGNNRPFVLPDGGNVNAMCDPGPPPPYSEEPGSAFYAEAFEVYEAVRNLTPEQNDIALFWADDPGRTATPPGHSISILNQLLRQENAPLDIAAEAYAKVGMAIADAFISCWYTKYQYNLVRPITYIQKVIDATWNTPNITDPVETPPFPEYSSGHSVQTGAAAQVLTDLFGNFPFTDHTHDSRGLAPRTFNSFFEMAEETAISRLYGGIHFRAAIDNGVEQGKCIGMQVSALRFRK